MILLVIISKCYDANKSNKLINSLKHNKMIYKFINYNHWKEEKYIFINISIYQNILDFMIDCLDNWKIIVFYIRGNKNDI